MGPSPANASKLALAVLVTNSYLLIVSNSFLLLLYSKALVTSSDALVPSSLN